MKKLLSVLLAAVMLFSACAVTAFAANGPMPASPEGWYGARIGFSNINQPENAYVVNTKDGSLVIDNDAFDGATYDRESNTLTLDNLDAANYTLFIWYMGDDFKLRVEGECAVGIIYVSHQFGKYNTNLNIIGTGSLTVNESRKNEAAIMMYGEADSLCSKIAVDGSVTLHLYGSSSDSTIISNYGTTVGTAAEAISVEGKGIEGVVGERIVYTEYENTNIAVVNNKTQEYTDGYAAKSKSDPDGRYSVSWWEEDGTRYVKHYVYSSDLGLWVADPSFGGYDDQKAYTKEEFENEFTIEQSEQPVKIRFTDDEQEQNKGWELVQLKKTGEPDEIYGGEALWRDASFDEDPDVYLIYHLFWDEAQGIYVQDEDYPYTEIYTVDLADNGFSFVTETVEQRKQLRYSPKRPLPLEEISWSEGDLMIRKSDPGFVYVVTGTYTSSYTTGNSEVVLTDKGIIVQKVRVSENGENYVTGYYNDEIHVSETEIGDDFSYVMETVTRNKKIKYIDSGYGFNNYSKEARLMEKAGDTSPYGLIVYDYSDREPDYVLFKLELRDNDHYYQVKWSPADDGYYGQQISADELVSQGYSYVTAEQDSPFVHIGEVDFITGEKCTDTQGKLYCATWDTVYAYSEDDSSVTFGDTTYYIAAESDKIYEELIGSAYEVETDGYSYTLTGTAYHYEGTGTEPTFLLGDADGDEKLTILDATAIQRKLASLSVASYNEKAADADEDGKVMILDATAIQRKLASLPTHEGIGEKRV